MAQEPVWANTAMPKFEKLTKNARYDVIVIGGGITGLTAAYLLKQAGKKVCLLERDTLARADTGHTTAHLTYVTDTRLANLVNAFGEEKARMVWQGGAAAITTIERICTKEKINCDFQRIPGFLHASFANGEEQEQQFEVLQKEHELAGQLGFPAAFMQAVPHFSLPGVRFPNQAKFHPRKYLAGLAKAIAGGGSTIHENAEVSEVSGDSIAASVGKFKVQSDALIIATHVPLMGKTGLLSATLFQTKLTPYSSYVVGGKIPKAVLPAASFWDLSDPYYYLRVDQGADFDYVIFGGEDHKTGQVVDTEECFRHLSERLLSILPEAKIDHRWSGQVVETHDGLPYIGETGKEQYVATGFSGNGMTFGTLSAMILCDSILKAENPWASLFDVDRKTLRGTWNYLKENFDFPYYLIRDRLSGVADTSTDEVTPGEGRIIERNGKRVACYKDEKGHLTTLSAVCTHMGCIVRWNQAESTWDCPCHGSRFSPTGEVLAGPAESPLEASKTE